MDIIDRGKKVIRTEIKGLEKLVKSLDYSFTLAVNILDNTTGKVVVTGMGKSGHIANKIAATMASTGKPAHCVHPSEASHGDMGMIVKGDSVLAISNSGESKELFDILHYCKRNNIPLIGITKEINSTLGKASTVPLIIPDHEEACPLGLAPTTSTTLSLALGDALAVAVYKDTFSQEGFSKFHPGGKLGSKLLQVKHIMHTGDSIPKVDITVSVAESLIEMSKKALGCVAVMDRNRLVGIVTDGDIRRNIDNLDVKKEVSSIMSKNPRTVKKEIFAAEALAMMNLKGITSLLVRDENGFCGVVHIHDCLRAGVDQ